MSPIDFQYQDETEIGRAVELFRALTHRQHILEIGSMCGGTLKLWMDNASPGATVVSVDAAVPSFDPRYSLQKEGHEVTWHQWASSHGHTFYALDRNSCDAETVAIVKRILPVVDFLFIDGGHDYTTCLSDWTNYGPIVRDGGMVAFHDIGREWPDVRRVWEPARNGKVSQEIVVTPDRFGIGVLWK